MSRATGDLLSSSSLLVTVVALLYSVWYSEIMNVLTVTPPRHRADRDESIDSVNSLLKWKAIPVAVAAMVLATLLAPPAIGISAEALINGRGRSYDPVQACFVAVWLLTLLLLATTLTTALRLFFRLRRLKSAATL